jgi:hypothetical protein
MDFVWPIEKVTATFIEVNATGKDGVAFTFAFERAAAFRARWRFL